MATKHKVVTSRSEPRASKQTVPNAGGRGFRFPCNLAGEDIATATGEQV